MEVVIFEANTIENLMETHSRYFAKPQKPEDGNFKGILGPVVAVGLVGLALYYLDKNMN